MGYTGEVVGGDPMSDAQRRRALGLWMRHCRKRLGITQVAAATRAGISRNHRWSIESGRTGIGIDKVGPIAQALEVDPFLAYEYSGYQPPSAADANGFTSLIRACSPSSPTSGESTSRWLISWRCKQGNGRRSKKQWIN